MSHQKASVGTGSQRHSGIKRNLAWIGLNFQCSAAASGGVCECWLWRCSMIGSNGVDGVDLHFHAGVDGPRGFHTDFYKVGVGLPPYFNMCLIGFCGSEAITRVNYAQPSFMDIFIWDFFYPASGSHTHTISLWPGYSTLALDHVCRCYLLTTACEMPGLDWCNKTYSSFDSSGSSVWSWSNAISSVIDKGSSGWSWKGKGQVSVAWLNHQSWMIQSKREYGLKEKMRGENGNWKLPCHHH